MHKSDWIDSEDLQLLCEYVDRSQYSLGDWQEALAAFKKYLGEAQFKNSDFTSILDYIHYSIETLPDVLLPPNLARIVEGYLEQYGYEAC